MEWSLHNLLVGLHILTTLTALAISLSLAVYAFGANCTQGECMSMIHITTTFFSTPQISTGAGWAVATERSQIGDNVVQYPSDKETYAFSHYFECMYTADMADKICPNQNSVAEYTVCLKNNTATTGVALAACDAISTTYPSHWPTPDDYMRCLFSFPVMQNTQSARASQNVFRTCVQKTMWPFFEIQQGVDSPLFLGSFNWLIFLTVGMVCMTSFAVYTASFYENGYVRQGETSFFMRLGKFWAGIATVWNLVFLILFITVAFRDMTVFENFGGLPTTGTTSLVTIVMTGVCLFYFGAELLESGHSEFLIKKTHAPDPEQNTIHHPAPERTASHHARDREHSDHHPNKIVRRHSIGVRLGRGMPLVYNKESGNYHNSEYQIADAKDVAKYYTPPLIATWADGYIADACIVLGMAGATGQLTTSQSWQLFTLVLFYRLLNMVIARFLYECFMNNVSESASVNQNKRLIDQTRGKAFSSAFSRKPEEGTVTPARISLKAMALSTQLAAWYLLVALALLVLNSNSPLYEFKVFGFFFWFAIFTPEAIRGILHLYCQVFDPEFEKASWYILNTSMFIWTYDVLIRIIFVCIVVFDAQNTPGTRKFLIDQSNALVRDYIPALYIPPLYAS